MGRDVLRKRPGMVLAAIAAMAQNRVIGRDGGIPWKIPGEQLLFKRITLGHTVIMGRRTFESLKRPLAERLNIVVSRRADFAPPGCLPAVSLQAALDLCPPEEAEAFIIGGGQLYAEALPATDRIYLSILPRAVEGDTRFPEISEKEFTLSRRERIEGPEPYDFCLFERIRPDSAPAASPREPSMEPQSGSYGWSPALAVSLQEKLKQDLKWALRARNEALKNTVRQVMSEFFKLTVPVTLEDGKKTTRPKKAEEITDGDIIGIIQGLVKSEQIVLEAKKEAASDYLTILQAYLPRQVPEEEIVAWIKANVDFGRYRNKMQAMGDIMKHFGRAADGKTVNRILKEWP